jgi:hypothetical protein
MSWSYSGDPASSTRDLVRFLLRDTDSSDQLLTNEELDYLVATWGNGYEAARAGALVLASKFTRQADLSKSVGDLSISESYGGRANEYRELAQSLAEQRQRLSPATPWAQPGNLVATANRKDLGLTDFRVGQFDNKLV